VASDPKRVTVVPEAIMALSFEPGATPPIQVVPSLHLPDVAEVYVV